MKNIVNIYCDESSHAKVPEGPMAIGALSLPKDKYFECRDAVRKIKQEYGLSVKTELKWTKISPKKVSAYIALIDYFFRTEYLSFRAVAIKDKKAYSTAGLNSDDVYYSLYFILLNPMMADDRRNRVYLDIKDTHSGSRVPRLEAKLKNDNYEVESGQIERVQVINSQDVELMGLVDVLVGALAAANRDDTKSDAKLKVIQRIRDCCGYTLKKSTLLGARKLCLYFPSLEAVKDEL